MPAFFGRTLTEGFFFSKITNCDTNFMLQKFFTILSISLPLCQSSCASLGFKVIKLMEKELDSIVRLNEPRSTGSFVMMRAQLKTIRALSSPAVIHRAMQLVQESHDFNWRTLCTTQKFLRRKSIVLFVACESQFMCKDSVLQGKGCIEWIGWSCGNWDPHLSRRSGSRTNRRTT